eukprot:SAG22_NODE_11116_length_500_cov_1.027431_1_plen_35_part_10
MQVALHQTLATSNIKAVFEKWDKVRSKALPSPLVL